MPKPTIVCLCGSTKFKHLFQKANLMETLDGKIVLTIGCDTNSDDEIFGHLSPDELAKVKASLDVLHYAKIDLADEILVLSEGGYVGESTRREIAYAKTHDKTVRWYEDELVHAAEAAEEAEREARVEALRDA